MRLTQAPNARLGALHPPAGRDRAPPPPRATPDASDSPSLPEPLAPLSPWLQSPGDILSFGPRAALVALLAIPRAGELAAEVAAAAADIAQDPRPTPDKAADAVSRTSQLLADFVATGAGAERSLVRAATDALPEEVRSALPRDFLDKLEDLETVATPSTPATPSDASPSGTVAGRGASEVANVARAARAVADAADALADAPPGQLPMRRLSAREARAGLARALEQAGSAGGGERGFAALASARTLLGELDDALTAVAG